MLSSSWLARWHLPHPWRSSPVPGRLHIQNTSRPFVNSLETPEFIARVTEVCGDLCDPCGSWNYTAAMIEPGESRRAAIDPTTNNIEETLRSPAAACARRPQQLHLLRLLQVHRRVWSITGANKEVGRDLLFRFHKKLCYILFNFYIYK